MRVKETTLLLVVVMAVSLVVPLVSAQPRQTTTQYVRIIDAYYADLDSDGYEDDVKLLVEFSFCDTEPSRVDILLWIQLPSGTTYGLKISVYRTPTESVLNVDCFDLATESGWYTVTMVASIMGAGHGRIYLTDEFMFDPPTGSGPGLPPSAVAYFC